MDNGERFIVKTDFISFARNEFVRVTCFKGLPCEIVKVKLFIFSSIVTDADQGVPPITGQIPINQTPPPTEYPQGVTRPPPPPGPPLPLGTPIPPGPPPPLPPAPYPYPYPTQYPYNPGSSISTTPVPGKYCLKIM